MNKVLHILNSLDKAEIAYEFSEEGLDFQSDDSIHLYINSEQEEKARHVFKYVELRNNYSFKDCNKSKVDVDSTLTFQSKVKATVSSVCYCLTLNNIPYKLEGGIIYSEYNSGTDKLLSTLRDDIFVCEERLCVIIKGTAISMVGAVLSVS